MPRWILCTLAVCAGMLLPLSFAPTEWWPLAILSLAALYALLQQATPRQALLLGCLFGLGYFGIGVHWVYFSLHLFGDAVAPLAALLTFVFILFMTVFPAVTALLWVRCKRPSHHLLNAAVFAALWVLSELLRGKVFDGFPWILVGYSQTTGPIGHLAPLLGVYGLSFLVLLASGLLVAFFQGANRSRLSALLLVITLVMTVFSLRNVSYSEPVGEPLAVRLVQGNIQQEMKFSPERLQTALDLYTQMSVESSVQDVDLIVWPETAIPTYFDRVDKALEPFVSAMTDRDVAVLSGGFQRDGDKVYNAVKLLGSDDTIYRKRHLVPFGEYMPLRFILDFASRFIEIPMSDLSSDDRPHLPLTISGKKIGVSICYEDVYGEEMRALLPDSALLVNVSNDAWFGRSAAPYQHEQKARMRAREFARPLIRVTNTGVSSAISHAGEILGRIPHETAGVVDVFVQPRSGQTVYARSGNWPVFLFCIIILVFVMFVAKKTQPSI